ncbi:unnamed protein product [Mytilus edulis]|uniref:Phospholipid scramblase n=1 Tax=Mytilus edulis TaxID=6550 RepID=A0A8S3TG16_MYTED|nr:unnamed protein product [Mytilus edulis]
MAQVRLHDETVRWMAKLNDLDEIIVKQHLSNFTIKDDSSCCWRFCCSRTRPLVIRINDSDNRTIMELKRPYRCSGAICGCCQQILSLISPNGLKLGQIKQHSADNLSVTVRDGSGKDVCIFEKDELSNSFTIKTKDKEIGKIQDTSQYFTEENTGAKEFIKENRSGITNEFKLTCMYSMNNEYKQGENKFITFRSTKPRE